jgi:hypothetical protein
MKDDIKRMAQFLFDNAEFLAGFLARSDNYRSLTVSFDHHKGDTGRKISDFGLYDAAGKVHEKLEGRAVRIGRVRELVCRLDEDTRTVPLPEQDKIRDSLE